LPEWLVLGSGVVAAAIAVVARRDLLAAYPTLDTWPTLTLTQLFVAGLALAGGLAAPVPVRPEAPAVLPVVAVR
jgi:hypothetical protein